MRREAAMRAKPRCARSCDTMDATRTTYEVMTRTLNTCAYFEPLWSNEQVVGWWLARSS
jgi:hypothetical protein